MHQNFILKQEIDSIGPNYAEACHCAQMLKATGTFGKSAFMAVQNAGLLGLLD
jgi:hypothetical protein